MKKTKQTAIRLDQNTWEWLDEQTQRTGKNASVLIREGIELLKAEVRVLSSLKAQFEASGVAYPAMKAQTAKGLKQVTLGGFDINHNTPRVA